MSSNSKSVIPKRTSRRSYLNNPLPPELIEKIESIINDNSVGPLGSHCIFKIVKKHSDSTQKLKLGTYGFIQGAKYFIVGQIDPSEKALLDYGFLLEKIILELTQLDLGTCWLGGTFDRGEFSKAIDINEGWVIPAITPFGFATKKRSLGDKIIRAGAKSKKRKNWEEIFFSAETKKPVMADQMKSKSQWLEMLRIAPSASNNQPWRVLVYPNKFQLFLSRKPGYQKMFGAVDIQMIDMGIAMCHLDISARHDNVDPIWEIEKDNNNFFDWEYIISLRH